MKTLLIPNFIEIDKLSEISDEYNLYSISEFKVDFLLEGLDFCLNKYSSDIYIINTFCDYFNLNIYNIVYTNLSVNDNITHNFLQSDINSYEKSSEYLTFLSIVSLFKSDNHKLISDNIDALSSEKYINVDKFSSLHITKPLKIREICDMCKFSKISGSIFTNYNLFLYNYSSEMIEILKYIFSNNMYDEEYDLSDFSIKCVEL